jgi:acetyltransferase-like isoleucine patch superfamily enzyme
VRPDGSVPRTDLRSRRFVSLDSLRWIIAHRAVTPWFLIRYWRFVRFRIAHPHIVVLGLLFLDRGVTITARRGYGRLVLEGFTHIGAGTAIRCHEGTMRIGAKCVIGRNVSINGYLDVDIGATTMIADNVYIADFDHRFDAIDIPIKDQGIVQSRVQIGRDVWLGTKTTVVRGVLIGDGAVIGANAVVTRDIPALGVAVGIPARVVRTRGHR